MAERRSSLPHYLESLDVEWASVGDSDSQRSRQRLESEFFETVRRIKGTHRFRGFYWHAFSFELQPAIHGDAARAEYAMRTEAERFVFDEQKTKWFLGTSKAWPDPAERCQDLYVVPSDFKWLYVTTHELSMGLGPYFAINSNHCSR